MAPNHTKMDLEDIKVEDIDFDVVKACTEKEVVTRYMKLLIDDGDCYHELMAACKEKLLELDPKAYWLRYPRQTTAKEIDEVTKDLLDWEVSVKETDQKLKNTRKQVIWDDVQGIGVTAPIRGQEAVLTRPNLHRKEEIKDEDQKRSGKNDGYARDKTKMKDYYSSWDKVDVDKMEADFDADEQEAADARKKHFEDMKDEQDDYHEKSHHAPVKTGDLPEGVPEAHRRHMADSEKEKGNEAFYAKDFEEADAYYSRSLHYRADDPSCWANRGLSRLKLNNAKGALEDCEMALAINPRYMKALHRKGKALYELARYEDAVECFQLALMESPGNTQINGDLMVARRKLRSDGPVGTPSQPKTFAPPTRSVDPRNETSCIIEEVFDDDAEAEDNAAASSTSRAAAAVTAPAAGYTRVAIEEDSSDSEGEAGKSSLQQTGFHKVQIQEDSDSEEGEPETEPVSSVPPSSAAGFRKVQIVDASDSEEEDVPASSSAGFHKVQVVEGSDSEEEEESAQQSPAPGVSAAAVEEEDGLDGMD